MGVQRDDLLSRLEQQEGIVSHVVLESVLLVEHTLQLWKDRVLIDLSLVLHDAVELLAQLLLNELHLGRNLRLCVTIVLHELLTILQPLFQLTPILDLELVLVVECFEVELVLVDLEQLLVELDPLSKILDAVIVDYSGHQVER